jgi:hypothetical protein
MPNQCGSMRIRILVRLQSKIKLIFTWKIYVKQAVRSKIIPTNIQKSFRKAGNQIYLLILSISMLLDPHPDPYPGQPNECGSMRSGSTTLEDGTQNRGRHYWTALTLHRQDPQNFILPSIPFSLHHNLFAVPSTLSACLPCFSSLYHLLSQMSFLSQLP